MVAGVGPLIVGLVGLADHRRPDPPLLALLAPALLCAFSFNLTFFIQELGLALPKAVVPGLHPILYHNDHDWTGHAPVAELLEGTGAISTLASGLIALALLWMRRFSSPTVQLLCFWMAFQGLFQALSQLAVGTLIPGNDVGRALTFLRVPAAGKVALLLLAVVGLCSAGRVLAGVYPGLSGQVSADRPTRSELLVPITLAILLIIPFRVPRSPIETIFIPVFVMTIGLGWLALWLSLLRVENKKSSGALPIIGPAFLLLALLAFFQLVLRRGIPI